jgi:acyl-CoA thioester hydrolase
MKKITEEEVQKELKLFKHSIMGQVKFHEVDSFGVVHNIQYFYFCEWARTKYLEFCGIKFDHTTFTTSNPLMTVYHEMNYFNPLLLSYEYEVYTRTSDIGNSSITIENIITDLDGKVIIKLKSVLVYLSTTDYKPTRIPDEFRNLILQMEGNDLISSSK